MSDLIPVSLLETPRPRATGRGRVALISLGCAKNLVDAEQMLGALTRDGYEPVAAPGEAEVVIVNTCSFVEAARDEAMAAIRGAERLKRLGSCQVLVVSGCLAQMTPDAIRERCPEVDAVVGVSEFPHIAELVARVRENRALRPVAVSLPNLPYQEYLPRRRATPPWTAYVKIAEGCNCACTFCTIPSIRGAFRSRTVEGLVAEARALAADGVRELVLIAEDVTHFGHERTGRRELAGLLRALGEVDGIDWIRLLYCYPTKVDHELIAAMAEVPAVLPYLDIPLQHADDGILRAMGRAGRRSGYLRLLDALREAMPVVCVRSTFIVGFPGERPAEFEALESFLVEARLDRVGFFAFSPEPGTPAAELPGQVRRSVAESRIARLAAVQEEISRARQEEWLGRSLDVLIESAGDQGGAGRSFRDAPEIDGVVRVHGRVQPGELVTVTITGAQAHDLEGVVQAAG